MTFTRRRVLPASAALAMTGSAAFADDKVEHLIATIRDAHKDGQPGVEDALKHLSANPGALLNTLGEPTKGGIRSLYNDSEITILNIVWAPLMVLRPHDHNMWASIGVYGGDFFAPGRSQWQGEDLQETQFSQTGLVKHFIESNERFGL